MSGKSKSGCNTSADLRRKNALEEPEEIYRLLFENAQDAIFIVNADTGIIEDANSTARGFLGRTLSEIRKMHLTEVVVPEQADIGRRRLNRILKDKRLGPQEYLIASPDGREAQVEARSFVIEVDNRKFAIGIFRDITERKTEEEKLRATKDLSDSLIEIANSIIITLDEQAKITTFNAFAETLTGYSKEEVLGENWFELFIPERDREDIPQVFAKVLRQMPEYSSYENPIIIKNGSERLIAWRNTVLKDKQGKIIGVLSIGDDITDSKRAEENLRWELEVNSSLARLAGALISSDISIEKIAEDVLDSARKLTRSKHGFVSAIDPQTRNNVAHTLTRMMGDLCQVTGEDRKISFPLGEDGNYPMLWGHALNTGKAFFTNEPLSHDKSSGIPKGHIPLNNYLAAPALLGEEVVGMISLSNTENGYSERDLQAVQGLAELYSLALHRQRSEDQLKSSLKEKEVLLREIHHRVKNNMQIISSLIRLQSRMVNNEQIADMFQTSQNRIRSMAIIHEKLYRSENLAKIDFGDYVRGLISHLISVYCPRGANFEVKVDTEEAHLEIGRAIPCGLIVNELVTNAMKHAFSPKKRGIITVSLKESDGTLTLIVDDNGNGFPESLDLKDIRSLGLQIVLDLVEQLNGTIHLERRGGTRFRITF